MSNFLVLKVENFPLPNNIRKRSAICSPTETDVFTYWTYVRESWVRCIDHFKMDGVKFTRVEFIFMGLPHLSFQNKQPVLMRISEDPFVLHWTRRDQSF
uniref:Uncharacterized protein n=1 Tax=Romanomermis culicivorax TaxID=13658 RepID=A0A915KZV0_ROMCU